MLFDNCDDFVDENGEFYNSTIKKDLTTINSMSDQLFAAGLHARNIYPEIKNYFYKEHSNLIWEEFLTTKLGLWVELLPSTDIEVVGQWEKNGILLQIEKVAESSDIDLICYVFSFEDAIAHLEISN